MTSRLGISISVATIDLIECGPAAEEGQSSQDHNPLHFIAAASTAARGPTAYWGEAEYDGAVHIRRMASDLSAMPHSTRSPKRVYRSRSFLSSQPG